MRLQRDRYFLVSFVDREMSQDTFNMDFYGRGIRNFLYFRKEKPRFTNRLAGAIDVEYEFGGYKSNKALWESVADASDEFFNNRHDCPDGDIF